MLTSTKSLVQMLTRRVIAPTTTSHAQPPPVPPKSLPPGVAAPAPALPLHLQQRPSISSPSSPIGPSRTLSPGPPSRPGSPAIRSAFGIPSSSTPVPPEVSFSCELLAHAPKTAQVERPFAVAFTLLLSSPFVPARPLHLALQRAQVPVAPPIPQKLRATEPAESFTPRLPSGLSTPTTFTAIAAPTPRTLEARLLVASPRDGAPSAGTEKRLPPPRVATLRARGVLPLGASAAFLNSATLGDDGGGSARGQADVTLEYIPVQRGLVRLGGVEVFLLEEGEEARSIGRWESAGEVWVDG
jgi:hypothetical protein